MTVQGPVKRQQPDGMSHGGGGSSRGSRVTIEGGVPMKAGWVPYTTAEVRQGFQKHAMPQGIAVD